MMQYIKIGDNLFIFEQTYLDGEKLRIRLNNGRLSFYLEEIESGKIIHNYCQNSYKEELKKNIELYKKGLEIAKKLYLL